MPATCASASAWTPTGVASTGTSHASASSTASPKPSRSEGTSTALAALTHSGTRSGSTPAERQQRHARSLRERARAIVALLGARWIGGEQDERLLGLQFELRACPRARQRPEAIEVHATRQHARAPARGASRQFLRERRGGGGEQPDRRQHRRGGQTRARVANVGAVHRQRAHSRRHDERRPRRQAEVRVDDLKARLRVTLAQRARRARERSGAGGNSYSSTSTPSSRRSADT